jgi:uncharacterized membrane protein
MLHLACGLITWEQSYRRGASFSLARRGRGVDTRAKQRNHHSGQRQEVGAMAIHESIEIGRPLQEVFDYACDANRFTEWQTNLVEVKTETEGPVRVGSRMRQTRRVGRGTRAFTVEVTDGDLPRWHSFKGIDGPVRPRGKITLEALDGGQRTRYSVELDFEGHGFGLLLTPLVRRNASKSVPEDLRRLKQKLESA